MIITTLSLFHAWLLCVAPTLLLVCLYTMGYSLMSSALVSDCVMFGRFDNNSGVYHSTRYCKLPSTYLAIDLIIPGIELSKDGSLPYNSVNVSTEIILLSEVNTELFSDSKWCLNNSKYFHHYDYLGGDMNIADVRNTTSSSSVSSLNCVWNKSGKSSTMSTNERNASSGFVNDTIVTDAETDDTDTETDHTVRAYRRFKHDEDDKLSLDPDGKDMHVMLLNKSVDDIITVPMDLHPFSIQLSTSRDGIAQVPRGQHFSNQLHADDTPLGHMRGTSFSSVDRMGADISDGSSSEWVSWRQNDVVIPIVPTIDLNVLSYSNFLSYVYPRHRHVDTLTLASGADSSSSGAKVIYEARDSVSSLTPILVLKTAHGIPQNEGSIYSTDYNNKDAGGSFREGENLVYTLSQSVRVTSFSAYYSEVFVSLAASVCTIYLLLYFSSALYINLRYKIQSYRTENRLLSSRASAVHDNSTAATERDSLLSNVVEPDIACGFSSKVDRKPYSQEQYYPFSEYLYHMAPEQVRNDDVTNVLCIILLLACDGVLYLTLVCDM